MVYLLRGSAVVGRKQGQDMTHTIRRHPLVTLFVLAYGLTWAIQMPRAAGLLEDEGWRAVTWARP
jgi:hypothetical protein